MNKLSEYENGKRGNDMSGRSESERSMYVHRLRRMRCCSGVRFSKHCIISYSPQIGQQGRAAPRGDRILALSGREHDGWVTRSNSGSTPLGRETLVMNCRQGKGFGRSKKVRQFDRLFPRKYHLRCCHGYRCVYRPADVPRGLGNLLETPNWAGITSDE